MFYCSFWHCFWFGAERLPSNQLRSQSSHNEATRHNSADGVVVRDCWQHGRCAAGCRKVAAKCP
jgi:hypothetical protein